MACNNFFCIFKLINQYMYNKGSTGGKPLNTKYSFHNANQNREIVTAELCLGLSIATIHNKAKEYC
jgi:hypothetical protein